MKFTEWDIINAVGDCIGKITTSRNNREAAAGKLKFKYPDSYSLLTLQEAGTRDTCRERKMIDSDPAHGEREEHQGDLGGITFGTHGRYDNL